MHYFHLIGLSDVAGNKEYVEQILPFADRLSIGWQTVVLGMIIIFSVLAILWLILEIFGRIVTRSERAAAPTATKTEEKLPDPEPTGAVDEAENDEEIVAAITAAISLVLEAEGSQTAFRVVSFKRNTTPARWNQ